MEEKKLKNIANDFKTILAITKNEVVIKGSTLDTLNLYTLLTKSMLELKFVDKNVLDKVYSNAFEKETKLDTNAKEELKNELKKEAKEIFKFLEKLFGE